MIARWNTWIDRTGSTRAMGLLRIGLVLACWGRWASELVLTHHPDLPARAALSGAFFATSTLLLVGWNTRVANVAFAAVLWWMYAWWGFHAGVHDWLHHHTYVLVAAITWLAFTPSGTSFSLDRWLVVRRARAAGQAIPPEQGPLWGVTLVAAQCSAVYLFSAYDKTNAFFLSGGQLRAIFQFYYTGSDAITLPGFDALCAFLGTTTVGLEYLLPVGLFVRSWRWWLVPIGLVFHAILFVTLPVSTFSVTMALLYLAYVDPESVHRVIDDLTL